MRRWLRKMWRGFVNFATVFSFVVNLALVLALLLGMGPLFQLKNDLLEPLLHNLDRAFLRLGETNIETAVDVDQPISIRFDLPLDQPLGLDFDLPINQETVVVLTQPVPLSRPATFQLYGSGTIYGNVYLELPAGMQLPVRLDMVVPVEKTIPVQMTVPVSQAVPVQMSIPVNILLGPAGLDPAVQELRDVFVPARMLIEGLPDGVRVR